MSRVQYPTRDYEQYVHFRDTIDAMVDDITTLVAQLDDWKSRGIPVRDTREKLDIARDYLVEAMDRWQYLVLDGEGGKSDRLEAMREAHELS